jgi:DHA1 family bicyclomycin/chloramphenicol resistance-like MFS transporter
MSLVNAIGTNSLSLLLQQRGQQAGSASALAISLQFGMGALASLAVSWLQDDTPFAMTLVMAVCAALGLLGHRMSVARLRPQVNSIGSKKQ